MAWTPCEEPAPTRASLTSRGAAVPWLASALRAEGCQVTETPGWQGRGHGVMGVIRGVLVHHTGGGGLNDWVVVRDGRADLAGPLAQLTLERDGTFRVIAAGVCWHAGSADNQAIADRVRCRAGNGNQYLIGIEGVSSGTTWTEAQRREYPRGVAAILRAVGLGADRVLGHKEWAPSRKPDPGGIDMAAFRADVGRHLAGQPASARVSTGSSAGSLSSSVPQGVLDMPMDSIPPGPQVTQLTMPIGPSISQVVAHGWLSLTSSEPAPDGHVWIHGARGKETEHVIPLPKNKRWVIELPDGTESWTIHTNSPGSVGWCLELQAP